MACLLLVGLAAPAWRGAAARQLVATSQDRIAEPIARASDEQAPVKFLQSYVVQRRSGMGTGPLIG